VVVRDDEHPLADARTPCRGREALLARQRMPTLPLDREVGQLDAEEGCAGNVPLEVQLTTGLPAVELVGAVDEAVVDQ
jgi:hypothetical protein